MKKIVSAAMIGIFMVLLVGCNNAVVNEMYDDDSKIAQSSDSYAKVGSLSISGEDGLFMSAGSFTGTETIWEHEASEDIEAEISYLLSVSSGGKAKLVLISPDDEVTIINENTDNSSMSERVTETFSLKKGKNRIKIVGFNSPELKLELDVKTS